MPKLTFEDVLNKHSGASSSVSSSPDVADYESQQSLADTRRSQDESPGLFAAAFSPFNAVANLGAGLQRGVRNKLWPEESRQFGFDASLEGVLGLFGTGDQERTGFSDQNNNPIRMSEKAWTSFGALEQANDPELWDINLKKHPFLTRAYDISGAIASDPNVWLGPGSITNVAGARLAAPWLRTLDEIGPAFSHGIDAANDISKATQIEQHAKGVSEVINAGLSKGFAPGSLDTTVDSTLENLASSAVRMPGLQDANKENLALSVQRMFGKAPSTEAMTAVQEAKAAVAPVVDAVAPKIDEVVRPETWVRDHIGVTEHKGSAILIVKGDEAGATFDPLTGQLTISKDKIGSPEHLDSILNEYKAQKTAERPWKGVNLTDEAGDVVDVDKTARLLGRKINTITRALECLGGLA